MRRIASKTKWTQRQNWIEWVAEEENAKTLIAFALHVCWSASRLRVWRMHALPFLYLSHYLWLILVSDDHVILKSMLTSFLWYLCYHWFVFIFFTTRLSTISCNFLWYVYTNVETDQIFMRQGKATEDCMESNIALRILYSVEKTIWNRSIFFFFYLHLCLCGISSTGQ